MITEIVHTYYPHKYTERKGGNAYEFIEKGI
jgi:hypothetical protein